ncbi:hypothetical protein [Actinacidiphila rubida]|uniref:Uncharacterized protein n=1 Tax=Actinacidiphila rubida TaxID=310780 RepID=A0A1H8K6F2_9ACTN|nr:hypothetical protein [Actinacidiphila rubida]SEN88287.1 hypothetical protein SAMN05216267_101211 [Actinacidiphila rubida]
MSRKGLYRVGGLAAAASAMVICTSGVASASVAPTAVVADSACQALELTKIIDGHDHMFVDPTVDNSSCYYLIVNMNTGYSAFDTWSPAGDQPQPDGVYDGPGVTLSVEVIDEANGAYYFGPDN